MITSLDIALLLCIWGISSWIIFFWCGKTKLNRPYTTMPLKYDVPLTIFQVLVGTLSLYMVLQNAIFLGIAILFAFYANGMIIEGIKIKYRWN